MTSSETSAEVAGSVCGDSEICAVVPAVVCLGGVTLRGFLAVVVRRPLWRLPVFFVGAGAPSAEVV